MANQGKTIFKIKYRNPWGTVGEKGWQARDIEHAAEDFKGTFSGWEILSIHEDKLMTRHFRSGWGCE
ncbi:hypothetical protein ACWLPO_004068 [Vibrio parahaemolyticus]|nr:hypothetical protein [Vibrio parahaemolyticus]